MAPDNPAVTAEPATGHSEAGSPQAPPFPIVGVGAGAEIIIILPRSRP
jgi:hypothetical protein